MSTKCRWFTVVLAVIVFLGSFVSLVLTWATLVIPVQHRLEVSAWTCMLAALSFDLGLSQYKALMAVRIEMNRKNFVVKYPRKPLE